MSSDNNNNSIAPNVIDYFATLTIRRNPKVELHSTQTAGNKDHEPVLVSVKLPNTSLRESNGKQLTVKDSWKSAITDIAIISDIETESGELISLKSQARIMFYYQKELLGNKNFKIGL